MEITSDTSKTSSTVRNESDTKPTAKSESGGVPPSRIPQSVHNGSDTFMNTPEENVDEAHSFDGPTSNSFSMEKMISFLRNGSESQQAVILFEIQQLLRHCFDETVEKLVPVMCECLPHRSEELQLSASEVFAELVQHTLPSRTSKMIANMAFRIIQSTSSEDSFEVWGEVLVLVLPDVKWKLDGEVRRLLQTVDGYSTSPNESSRKVAARILGALSASLQSDELKRSVLTRALRMVRDHDAEVRGMVAESFSYIGAGLDLRLSEKTLWPKLLALLDDPDARIHAASIRSIAHILEAKRDDAKRSTFFKKVLPSVLAKECALARKAASEDQRTVDDDSYLLLEITAEVFGPFVNVLHPFLSNDIKKEAFKAFLAMSTCNGPIVRRYCAFNFPGVALSLQSAFKTELAGIVEFLSRDADSETRWNLAAGIHKTCSILMSKHSMQNLQKGVMALFQDKNPLVRLNVLENLNDLVEALNVTPDGEKGSAFTLTSLFRRLALLSQGNWRTQELLAKQLKQTAELVPHHCLKENVLPLLYQMAEEGASCVRKVAMMAIAKTLWCIPLPEEREEALQMFFLEWGKGGVYWMRIAFVDCAEEALKIFSNDLYSYLFLPALYQLARDNVANVRLRVARMLHEVAPFNLHDEKFQQTITWFKEDTDADVRAAMDDIKWKINGKMKNFRTIRKENEAREEAETMLEEQARPEKGEHRKMATKAKMRATAILPKIANLSPRTKTPPSLSPVIGSPDSRSPRTSPSSVVSGSGKSKDSGKANGGNGESNGKSNGKDFSSKLAHVNRKALKQMLSVASPRRSKRDQTFASTGKGKASEQGENN